mgnify:CR=1 FL=1
MKLVVGLGNPGEKYQGVRHNLGFQMVGGYVRKMDGGDWKMEDKFKAEVTKMGDLVFACPQTYMNNSGMAVSLLVNFYKINPEDVIVIYDELDLPLGKIKVRLGGAAAGHHHTSTARTMNHDRNRSAAPSCTTSPATKNDGDRSSAGFK